MHKHLLALAAAAALLAAAPAHAIGFNGVMGGDSDVTDWSTDGLLSFDIDFKSRSPVTLSYTIDAADVAGGSLAFNSVLRNYLGAGVPAYTLTLSAGQFAPVGTVSNWSSDASIAFNGAAATIRFPTAEYLDVAVGNALGNGGTDWAIAGLNGGDTFTITVSAVPEPETYALLLAGLGIVAGVARRRKKD